MASDGRWGTAQRWLDNGAHMRLIEAVARSVLGKKHQRGEKPPRAIKYLDGAIREAMARGVTDTSSLASNVVGYRPQLTPEERAELTAQSEATRRQIAAGHRPGGG